MCKIAIVPRPRRGFEVPRPCSQDVSPDDGAQEEVTDGLSRFAGSFKADGKT